MTEDPQSPQDDETPEAASGGDVAEPEQSADPAESPAEESAPDSAAPEVGDSEADEAIAAAQAEGAAESSADASTTEPQSPEPEAASTDAPDEPSAEDAAAGEFAPAAAGDDTPAEERRERPKPAAKKKGKDGGDGPEVVPGAHLEPDLVLESGATETPDEFGAYAQTYNEGTNPEDGATDDRPAEPPAEGEEAAAEAPAAYKPIDIAADARYHATGKRKTAVARVILKPGTGNYTVNGKSLEEFFPRLALQKNVRRPLETAGQDSRMDVVVKIHGGGVSSQAGALRHGISKALVEADPNLRTELKKYGFLTRDARVKERKKAGLKKARKRPQFSKR
jgi:small subunit ribosomal protein S9